jgi:hypothetical protein
MATPGDSRGWAASQRPRPLPSISTLSFSLRAYRYHNFGSVTVTCRALLTPPW